MKVFDFTIKKSIILAWFVLCGLQMLKAQNLVVNPGFEMPADSNALIPPGEYTAWKALGWSVPTRAQATLYSSVPVLATTNRALSRWKFAAKEGNNVVGIMTYGIVSREEKTKELREYIQGSLTQPLVVGKKYYISYWVHFNCEGTNNIGVAFVTKPVGVNSVERLDLRPIVNNINVIDYKNGSDWVQVKDSFIAREPFKHFIIGNFFANKDTKIQSNKYHYHKAYFDDIVIEDASSVKTAPVISDSHDNMLVTNDKKKENVVTTPSIVTTPSVKEPSNSDNAINKNTSVASNPKMSTPSDAQPVNMSNGVAKGEVLILDKVYFYIGSSRFKTESMAQLNKLLTYLQQNDDVNITVKGHTSSDGSAEFNLKLSQNRSKAVADYLISKGIKAVRITYKGFGETQPLESNDTEMGRQKNRRVEFEIVE